MKPKSISIFIIIITRVFKIKKIKFEKIKYEINLSINILFNNDK